MCDMGHLWPWDPPLYHVGSLLSVQPSGPPLPSGYGRGAAEAYVPHTSGLWAACSLQATTCHLH